MIDAYSLRLVACILVALPQNINMKKAILGILFLVLIFAVWKIFIKSNPPGVSSPKQQALKAGKHSPEFNAAIDTLIGAYLEMKNDFVEADSIKAKEACKKMLALTDSLKLSELKKDTSGIFDAATAQLSTVKEGADSLIAQTNLTDMRKDFQWVSESLYPLLKTIHYEGPILYWQNCPMAFGEDHDASWISNTSNIINPYLGKKNAEYHATMVGCGETKDSIKAQ
jgi:hypothetical protein